MDIVIITECINIIILSYNQLISSISYNMLTNIFIHYNIIFRVVDTLLKGYMFVCCQIVVFLRGGGKFFPIVGGGTLPPKNNFKLKAIQST